MVARAIFFLVGVCIGILGHPLKKEKKQEPEPPFKSENFDGLKLRELGPALTSGRIGDFAVHPKTRSTYYVAVSSGGVWKTTNAGTTWTPIFDDQGSYSIGCVAIDPNQPLTVWVGTGENNSQRSVGYGDGIYKSTDGGKSWKNMGLQNSEHIAEIYVDPRDSNTVFVAAQGPLWSPGGDRGLYKSTDGGQNWTAVLTVDEHTGVSDIAVDPRNPDIMLASTYQRRRHVWTLVNGGPGSAIHKTTDGGATWKKVTKGLPSTDLGRIGLAISPANPDVVYAIVEAADDKSGFFRSQNLGENWEKQSGYVSGSPQYYQEIVADPKEVGRVYSMDTWLHVTEDGGKNFQKVYELTKHVDNHAMWIDPDDTNYLLVGCDGGIYESFDRGSSWQFKANLPVTQFYKIAVDNDTPFYNVYGGTQDNFTLGGPSRTLYAHGIANRDWFVTLGGDGFEPQVDPANPDIVYSQYQYGGLARFDKRSGEILYIQPQPGKDEPAYRWNWDSPLLISPHDPARIYYAANILFRSDDRGNGWRAVSPDLTRNLDRNQLEVMGKIQSVDAVSKNASTSYYGNIVALDESRLKENLLVVGTDDGLIQITEDGGSAWRKLEQFPGIPERTYVNAVVASKHQVNRLYAAFNNHKMGDFRPYLLKSEDLGASWQSISSNLPQRGSVYSLAEDHQNQNLLFAGTELGLFVSFDGGGFWTQLKSGLPTIAVRDLAIQERENDLVLGTFGRGFYVLDDYSPLRQVTQEMIQKDSLLFQPRRAWQYMVAYPLGIRGKAFQGDNYYVAENPPYGAVFTYYLAEELKTLKKQRQEREKEIEKEGGKIAYPNWDELRAEYREEDPAVVLTVRDGNGEIVRRLTGPTGKGFQRVAWDFRYPPADPTSLRPGPTDNPFVEPPIGPMVEPGTYSVSLAKRINGETVPIGEPQSFDVVAVENTTLPAPDRGELLAFQRKTADLQRAVFGAEKVMDEAFDRLKHLKKAIDDTPGAEPEMADRVRALENKLKDLRIVLSGDRLIRSHREPVPPSISGRIGEILTSWGSTAAPTQTHRQEYAIAAEAFAELLPKLQSFIETDLAGLEASLEEANGPWTPGRLPDWKPE